MERQKFEDEWKKAFDEAAGISPSEGVWTNIALDLEKAKGTSLKKKLVFFQMLAAACVIFTMGVAVGVFVMDTQRTDTTLPIAVNDPRPTESTSVQKSTNEANNSSTSIKADDKTSTIKDNPIENEISDKLPQADQITTDNTVSDNLALDESNAVNDEESRFISGIESWYRPALAGSRKAQLVMAPVESTSEVDPVAMMLARLEQREKEITGEQAKKETSHSENLWTSVGFSTGSFNPVNSGVSSNSGTMAMAQNNSIANQEAKASGVSYSIGANVGTKLSERWVFQGGVNYLSQSSDYTAHSAVGSADFTTFKPASINELENLNVGDEPSASRLVTTAPYNVTNNLRYLSIPLQAGYLIINRDFGLQLNAGIATDVFLQNTVSAEGQNLDDISQGIGEDSPYRSVNLSGLMGTEISYKFSRHYRVSLNPGLRYPFNSIYRTELNVKATPLSFDLGLRFRYIFR